METAVVLYVPLKLAMLVVAQEQVHQSEQKYVEMG